MVKKSNRIKIIVSQPKDNLNLRLPALPFWLITSFTSFAMLFKPMILRNSNLEQDVAMFLNNIDSKTIRMFINEFRMIGPFDLVDISTGDGTIVKISIL